MSGVDQFSEYSTELNAEIERLVNRTLLELSQTTLEEDEAGLVDLGMSEDGARNMVVLIDRFLLGAK